MGAEGYTTSGGTYSPPIPESDVTSLVSDLAAKAASAHTHTEANVTNLVSDLAAKAASSHTHAESDVTSLTADLAARALAATQVIAGNGLTGGGTLAADRTLTVATTATVPLNSAAGGSAGSAITFSRSDHQHPGNGWSAADHSLIAWNFPNYIGGASQILSLAGTLTVWKVPMSITTNITNVVLAVGSVGVSLTSNQCYAGLWLADGTFKGLTADQSAAWVSAGVKVMPLTGGPFSNGGQHVYVGAWFNGSTSPGFVRAGSAPSGLANVGLASSATYNYATANTGLTDSTSGSVSLGTRSASNNMIWAAVS